MTEKKATDPRRPPLSEAEWTILKAFWEKGPLAARDVYAAVTATEAWSYTTVKTMLSRLVKKGVLHYTQVGNSYLYSACVGRDRVVRQEVRRFSRRVLEGALQPFLVHFFDGRAPTPEEAALLHDLIRNAEKRPPKPR